MNGILIKRSATCQYSRGRFPIGHWAKEVDFGYKYIQLCKDCATACGRITPASSAMLPPGLPRIGATSGGYLARENKGVRPL